MPKAEDMDDIKGLADLQEKFDEDLDRGYRGRDSLIPNSEYSQETDPTKSPGSLRIDPNAQLWDPHVDPENPTLETVRGPHQTPLAGDEDPDPDPGL